MILDAVREPARLKSTARRAAMAPVNSPGAVFWAVATLSVLALLCVVVFPSVASSAVFVPLLVASGIFLSGRSLVSAMVLVLTCYVIAAMTTWGRSRLEVSVAVVMLCVTALIAAVARERSTGGVPLSVGSGMLLDLRQRLDTQAQLPPLVEGFRVEACVLPARGDAFSGDFVVSSRQEGQFDLALTDVSGNGPTAATRALLLSGALSGLLGETRPENFLPAANRYLIRQGWRDGFASAIHVSMNLEDGSYCLGTAGHPTAAHYHAGTRRWEMIDGASGLLLGLFDQGPEDFTRAEGRLEPGDVLLLYTDGVVEGPGGDLLAGTHQMLAIAQSAIGFGLEGAAQRICETSARLGGQDDRSVVVLWRSVPESSERHHNWPTQAAPSPSRGHFTV